MGTLRIKRGTKTALQDSPGFTPAEGELVYTTDSKEVFVGDGATVGGVPVSVSTQDLEDLGNVQALAPQKDQILVYNGSNWAPTDNPALDLRGNIYADDSTLLVDAINGQILGPVNTTSVISSGNIVGDLIGDVTGSVTGSVIGNTTGSHFGNVVGDIEGSVFADDSSLLLDAINGTLHAPNMSGSKTLYSEDGNRAIVELVYDNMGDLDQSYGEVIFSGRTTTGLKGQGLKLVGGRYGLFIQNDFATGNPGNWVQETTTTITYEGIAYGTYFPQNELDIRGNGSFTGFVQFGSLTTTERDALTAANGMVIYNTTDNKFQGYENGAWVNLVA